VKRQQSRSSLSQWWTVHGELAMHIRLLWYNVCCSSLINVIQILLHPAMIEICLIDRDHILKSGIEITMRCSTLQVSTVVAYITNSAPTEGDSRTDLAKSKRVAKRMVSDTWAALTSRSSTHAYTAYTRLKINGEYISGATPKYSSTRPARPHRVSYS
jgi:hypothetical protein